MWSNTVAIEIQAPPAKIFAYLADFSRHAEWSSSVVAIKLVGGETGQVGAEHAATESIPIEMTTYTRITDLETPRHIEWESTDKRVFRTKWRFDIEPVGENSRLTQSVTFHPLTLFASRVLYIVRVPIVPNENLQSLGRIKERMESGPELQNTVSADNKTSEDL